MLSGGRRITCGLYPNGSKHKQVSTASSVQERLQHLNPLCNFLDNLIRSVDPLPTDGPISLSDAKLNWQCDRVEGKHRQPIGLTNSRFPSLRKPFLRQNHPEVVHPTTKNSQHRRRAAQKRTSAHIDESQLQTTHLMLPKSLCTNRRLYSSFAALASARRLPKMRDRSLGVRSGFSAASFPVANEKSSSMKTECGTAWLGCSDASSPK